MSIPRKKTKSRIRGYGSLNTALKTDLEPPIPLLVSPHPTCGVLISKPASAMVVGRVMDSLKGRERTRSSPSWLAPVSRLLEFGRDRIMRLRALSGFSGSGDIFRQGGEGSILVKHPNEVRGARQEYPLARFHEFYRRYIPYNQRT